MCALKNVLYGLTLLHDSTNRDWDSLFLPSTLSPESPLTWDSTWDSNRPHRRSPNSPYIRSSWRELLVEEESSFTNRKVHSSIQSWTSFVRIRKGIRKTKGIFFFLAPRLRVLKHWFIRCPPSVNLPIRTQRTSPQTLPEFSILILYLPRKRVSDTSFFSSQNRPHLPGL